MVYCCSRFFPPSLSFPILSPNPNSYIRCHEKIFWMENTVKKTASKFNRHALYAIKLSHFNEEYADRIERDIEELNTILASLNERTVYDYTCRNNNVPSVYSA